jgi:dTDP-glucose pyrophosphorylase
VKWQKALIVPDASLEQALENINIASTQMALVVDGSGRLLGTLSDGDVRRALLAGKGLSEVVRNCMNTKPKVANITDSRLSMLTIMRQNFLHQLPLIDTGGKVVGLKRIEDLLSIDQYENWVVIMAGGLGSRLKDLTKHTPKPMLAVGNRPLLENIVENFVAQGFKNIWIAVNYHANQIMDYFGSGEKFGVNIQYLQESKRMGTAGALSLLPIPDLPVLISNADLLTKIDYSSLLSEHIRKNSAATMAVREHEFQVPFGVVKVANGKILSIEEKPVNRAIVNAGVYALSPQSLAYIPKDSFFDMPDLFNALIEKNQPVYCHLTDGYWLDIGRHEDLQQAHVDYKKLL